MKLAFTGKANSVQLTPYNTKHTILYVWETINDITTFLPVMELLGRTHRIVVIATESQDLSLLDVYEVKARHVDSYRTRDVRKILAQEKPSVIVTSSEESLLARAFCLSGSVLGIESVAVPHAPIPELVRRTRFSPWPFLSVLSQRDLRRDLKLFFGSSLVKELAVITVFAGIAGYWRPNHTCTKICAAGENSKGELASRGLNASKIVVTGHPRFDTIYEVKRNGTAMNTRQALAIGRDQKAVLFVTQPYVEDGDWLPDQADMFTSEVLDAINSIPGCMPVIKIHPRENRGKYHNLLTSLYLNHIPVVQDEIPLHHVLAACDVAIGTTSAAIIDAMAMDKPVIIADILKMSDHFGFISSGAAFVVKNIDDLASAIQSALYDEERNIGLRENRDRFVHDNAYLVDGNASRRVADVIEDVVSQSTVSWSKA